MCRNADDCSPYEHGGSIDDVISELQNDLKCLINWFLCNYLKLNSDKWHILLSDKDINHVIKIDNEEILNSTEGVYFDNKLNFNIHVTTLCKKASQKLHALARLLNVIYIMSIRQRKIIMNAFIISQFSYCPLIRMSHSRTINSLVNNIHERALRIHHLSLSY